MADLVNVQIGGATYSIRSEENEDYVRKIAEKVDTRLSDIQASGTVSALESYVLTALDLADEAEKAEQMSANMREQMKSYLEDTTRLRNELNEARKEISRLRQTNQYR